MRKCLQPRIVRCTGLRRSGAIEPSCPILCSTKSGSWFAPRVRVPDVCAPKQQAGDVDHSIQSAPRKRTCILAVPEITNRVEHAQVDHGTSGYRGGDGRARITLHQPMARQPKCRHDPEEIGEKKTPLEIHHVHGEVMVIVPERNPEKYDGQRGYSLGPRKAAYGYVHVHFLC